MMTNTTVCTHIYTEATRVSTPQLPILPHRRLGACGTPWSDVLALDRTFPSSGSSSLGSELWAGLGDLQMPVLDFLRVPVQ